jgi:hypothetical protein
VLFLEFNNPAQCKGEEWFFAVNDFFESQTIRVGLGYDKNKSPLCCTPVGLIAQVILNKLQ